MSQPIDDSLFSNKVKDVAYLPLGNRVLVKPIDSSKESPIIIVDTAKEKPLKGTIVAIGTSVPNGLVSIGDTISFLKYSGADLELEEGKFLSLNMDEVLGKILIRT